MNHHRGGGPQRVQFDMTPMIDCCFQLIIFFMLSLKLLQPEGDFDIRMPRAANIVATPTPPDQPLIRVRLAAAPGGQLSGIVLGERSLSGFEDLRQRVRELVADESGPASQDAEVELACDYGLDYEYAIRAITAVSGYTDRQGNVVRLVERIRFAEPGAE